MTFLLWHLALALCGGFAVGVVLTALCAAGDYGADYAERGDW